MSGGVDVQFPGDALRCRPQLLYLPSNRHRLKPLQASLSALAPSDLTDRLNSPTADRPLVLDCRSALAFSRGHVAGAVSLRAADRISRRRLALGRLGLCDLVSDPEGKDRLKGSRGTEVVLYDEGTKDPESVTDEHPLAPVVVAIKEMGAKPVLLKGGWREFSKTQPASCHSPQSPDQDSIPTQIEEEQTPRATAILPFLYVGNARDAEDVCGLKELGIRYVLNVTNHVPEYSDDQGFIFMRLPAMDSFQQNIKQYFKKAFAFIDEARKRNSSCLVHCQAGVSRSATIVIGYLMYQLNLTSMEAYQMVKSKRPIISPNLHFMGQLLELEQILNKDENS